MRPILVLILGLLPFAVISGNEVSRYTIVGFNARHSDLDEEALSWENRREAALELLRGQQPDIIGLQEAAGDQRRDLAVLDLDCIECDPGFSNHNAILYRSDTFELIQSGVFWLSDTPDVPESISWGNDLPRWVTWALLRPRGRRSFTEGDHRFLLYNTHLDHQSQPSRMWSLRAIMAHARKMAADADVDAHPKGLLPMVLMGDLNAKPHWPELDFILDEDSEFPHLPLRDVLAREGADEKVDGTYHAFDGEPELDRIDYILISAGLDSRDGAVLTEEGADGIPPSDHFPIRAEIRIRTAGD
jgi:endonuclease/exonuclease/phosphatase family metal-dependent hydrolase